VKTISQEFFINERAKGEPCQALQVKKSSGASSTSKNTRP
jgi:hypothetical protein